MDKRYTAIIKQNGQWWIGWIEEIPGVNCQEATKEELLESLQGRFAKPWISIVVKPWTLPVIALRKHQSPYETRRFSSSSPHAWL
jgi:hypothetical protein